MVNYHLKKYAMDQEIGKYEVDILLYMQLANMNP